eukprot:scaffold1276_cov162-Amphora_coffeaeformis.AAC.2
MITIRCRPSESSRTYVATKSVPYTVWRAPPNQSPFRGVVEDPPPPIHKNIRPPCNKYSLHGQEEPNHFALCFRILYEKGRE